jgi:phosphatidylserine/phosphatidylglycerophosphate/cardiolipin synthase-like enzyme
MPALTRLRRWRFALPLGPPCAKQIVLPRRALAQAAAAPRIVLCASGKNLVPWFAKRGDSALMHLKSYEIDGRLLRTGAANFSASGLKRQDNELIVIESRSAAAVFKRNFEARFASGEALPHPRRTE